MGHTVSVKAKVGCFERLHFKARKILGQRGSGFLWQLLCACSLGG